jgi:DinB superfamily
MLFHSLDEIFTHLDTVRGDVVKRLETMDESQLGSRHNDQGWNPQELAEHLSIVEKSITGVVERLLSKSEELGVPASPDGKIDPPVKFTSLVRNPEMNKVEAPERIRPQGNIPVAESLQNLAASREHIKSLRPRMAALDLSQAKFPHPVMNELDLYQWLLFIAEHEARHLAQIENILKQ